MFFVITVVVVSFFSYLYRKPSTYSSNNAHLPGVCGQVENTERKPKYGNGNTEVRRKATYQFTNVPCRQRVTVSKQCENQVVIHRTPASTNTVV